MSLSPLSSPLSPRFWAVGPIRPSLVRGLRPRNAPPKPRHASSTWCRYSNRCLFEGVWPDHVPLGPSGPRRCRPCACPRTIPYWRPPPYCQAQRLHCVSPKDGKQRKPPLALIPRQTVPTPNLGCTRGRGCILFRCLPAARPLIPRRIIHPTDTNRSPAILKIPFNPENPDSDNDHPQSGLHPRATVSGRARPTLLQFGRSAACHLTQTISKFRPRRPFHFSLYPPSHDA